MRYVGMDYHKKYSQVTVMDEGGEILSRDKLPNEPADIQRYFEEWEPCEVALEACRNWSTMYDWLEGRVQKVHLAHTTKVKAIASARIKTDKIDSEVLAHLLRSNLLPCAHIPSKEARQRKQVLRQRMFFVGLRTMAKNRIHDIMDRNHINTEQFTDLFGKRGMEYLRQLKLCEHEDKLLKEEMGLLEQLNEHISKTEEFIDEIGRSEPRLELVKSIPGIGNFLGLLILSEIDTIERFGSSEKLASYAGLVPSTYASGGKVWHGRITKQGNRYLRWAMVEAVWPAIRSSGYVRSYYERIKTRSGVNHAKVATARKLLSLVYVVLKEKREYQEYWRSGLPSSPPSLKGSLKG